MAIAVVITIFTPEALGATSIGFAIAYSLFLILLTFLWWRTGVHDPAHRPQTIPYIVSYPIGILFIIISLYVPIPFRFILWWIALIQMLIIPSILSSYGPRKEYFSKIRLSSESLIERFKAFTIIVIGELIFAVVTGLSQIHHLNIINIIEGSLGLMLVFGIWWIYFEFSSECRVKSSFKWFWLWNYIHIPIWIGITAIAPALLKIILLGESPITFELRWLLTGTISIVLISIGVLLHALDDDNNHEKKNYLSSIVLYAMGGLTIIFGILGEFLTSINLLSMLQIVIFVPILYGLRLRLI